MKKIILSFLLLFISLPAANASNQIILTEKPIRNYDGTFPKENSLETDLAATGLLGQKVFSPLPKPRLWLIDPALIEDVLAYEKTSNSIIAKAWLNQLNWASSGDSIFATAYGNPDVSLSKKISSSELKFYYDYGKELLANDLNRSVYSAEIGGWNLGRAQISNLNLESYKYARKQLQDLATVIPENELNVARAKLAKILTLNLDGKEREKLATSYIEENQQFVNKLRVVAGKYRLTSNQEKLPITLVNGFESAVTVRLKFDPLNARIQFPKYEAIELKPKSRVQIRIPVTNIAAGDTAVIARFENEKGTKVGGSAIISISSQVISPFVAWFTTGAGILLILGAVIQSVRRVKRARDEK